MKQLAFLSTCLTPLTLLILAGLASCNLSPEMPPAPILNVTQAYQTVEARLTEAVTQTPVFTESPQPTETIAATQVPTNTSPPLSETTPTHVTVASPNAPENLCDQASAGTDIDVTIPDDTRMQPGHQFTKIWRLTNAGTCTWTPNYHLVWFSGEKLGAPISVPLAGNVAPRQTVEIAVDMVAPQQPGIYQSYWKLRNPAGVLFGIGPSGVSSFWVRIEVVEQPTTTPTLPTATPAPTETPTLTPTPGIQASGPVTMQPGDLLNLDTNQLNSGDEDLAYLAADSGYLLDPLGSAAMAVFGTNQPTISECQSLTLSADPLAIESLAAGTYLCYRTNNALPGWAQITAFELETGLLSLEILTWMVP